MTDEEQDKSMHSESTLSERAREPGFWRDIWQQARLVYYLLRDPKVPFYLKLLPMAAFGYLLMPFDLVTDLAPIIGQLDDLTAMLVLSKVFIELSPPEIVARHMAVIRERDGFVASVVGRRETAASFDDEVADAIIIEGEHEVIDK